MSGSLRVGAGMRGFKKQVWGLSRCQRSIPFLALGLVHDGSRGLAGGLAFVTGEVGLGCTLRGPWMGRETQFPTHVQPVLGVQPGQVVWVSQAPLPPTGPLEWGWGTGTQAARSGARAYVPASAPRQPPIWGSVGPFGGLCPSCPMSPHLLSGLSPQEKGSALPPAVGLPASVHPVLIFPGKINSSNMSALKWRYNELFPALGTQGLQPSCPLVGH